MRPGFIGKNTLSRWAAWVGQRTKDIEHCSHPQLLEVDIGAGETGSFEKEIWSVRSNVHGDTFLAGMTYFIAGWNFCANRKPKPQPWMVLRTCAQKLSRRMSHALHNSSASHAMGAATASLPSMILAPRASKKSALPTLPDADRFPGKRSR